MAKAAQMMYENLDEDIARLYRLKKLFIEEVKKIDGTQVNGLVNGGIEGTAPHIVSVSIEGVRSEVLCMRWRIRASCVRRKRLLRPQAPALRYLEGNGT